MNLIDEQEFLYMVRRFQLDSLRLGVQVAQAAPLAGFRNNTKT